MVPADRWAMALAVCPACLRSAFSPAPTIRPGSPACIPAHHQCMLTLLDTRFPPAPCSRPRPLAAAAVGGSGCRPRVCGTPAAAARGRAAGRARAAGALLWVCGRVVCQRRLQAALVAARLSRFGQTFKGSKPSLASVLIGNLPLFTTVSLLRQAWLYTQVWELCSNTEGGLTVPPALLAWILLAVAWDWTAFLTASSH